MQKQSAIVHAIGRRKTATARVFIKAGTGKITVNQRPATDYFGQENKWIIQLYKPLDLFGVRDQYDIFATVKGGGITGQADAIRLAIARALDSSRGEETVLETPVESKAVSESDDEGDGPNRAEAAITESQAPKTWHQILRASGYLTRDARSVLRKRVGLVKARKAKQFSKR